MKKTSTIVGIGLMAGLLALTGLPAAAQNVNDPGIQKREARQQDRIQQGVNSGQLSQGEATRLENQQSHLQAAEGRMKADGNLNQAERAKLTRMQDRASRNVCRKKHNDIKAN